MILQKIIKIEDIDIIDLNFCVISFIFIDKVSYNVHHYNYEYIYEYIKIFKFFW